MQTNAEFSYKAAFILFYTFFILYVIFYQVKKYNVARIYGLLCVVFLLDCAVQIRYGDDKNSKPVTFGLNLTEAGTLTNGVYQVFVSYNDTKDTNTWVVALSPYRITQVDTANRSISGVPHIGNPIFVKTDYPVYGMNNSKGKDFTSFVEVSGEREKKISVYRPFAVTVE